jgi:hypothetical protein
VRYQATVCSATARQVNSSMTRCRPAAAIGRLLDEPELAARIGAAGRQRVIELFTWRAVAEQTVAWYRTVLEEDPC